MEGRQPKRRKDKYNPYEIYEKDGKYYVSFRNVKKSTRIWKQERMYMKLLIRLNCRMCRI